MYRSIDLDKISDGAILSFADIQREYHISRRTLEVARQEGRLMVLKKRSTTTGVLFKNYLLDPLRVKTTPRERERQVA